MMDDQEKAAIRERANKTPLGFIPLWLQRWMFEARKDIESLLAALEVTGLRFGENKRDGDDRVHQEWHAACGCAYHPEPFPHIHPCSDAHKRPDLHGDEGTIRIPENGVAQELWLRVGVAQVVELRAQVDQLKQDAERLDWLNEFIESGMIEAALEVDGGINLRLSAMGDREPVDLREQDSIRAAIDSGRAALSGK